MPRPTFQTQKKANQEFIRLLQVIRFGRIEKLVIRNGGPVLDPLPLIIRDVKFGSTDSICNHVGTDDFALKREVIELFDELSKLDNGMIDVLEIRHGLPFRMSVATVSARKEATP